MGTILINVIICEISYFWKNLIAKVSVIGKYWLYVMCEEK